MSSLAISKQSKYQPQDLQEWHIQALAQSIDEDDRREVSELYGVSPEEIIRRSAERSVAPKAFVHLPNTVLCICGVAPDTLLSSSGQIWCLTSKDLCGHTIAFLRISRMWLKEQRGKHSVLWNYVPAWHFRSLKWLRWLGFTVSQYNEELLKVELRGK